MQILDEDTQKVRDFLAQAKAPFHIQSHFENLVETQAADAERVEELQAELDECGDYDDLKHEVARLQDEVDQRDSEQMSALETVKYWLHDVLFLGRPMQKPPREILRIVEKAL